MTSEKYKSDIRAIKLNEIINGILRFISLGQING